MYPPRVKLCGKTDGVLDEVSFSCPGEIIAGRNYNYVSEEEYLETVSRLDALKSLAIAYSLAQEFDYVPSEDSYEDAKNFYGEFDMKILVEHQGSRADEIAGQLVQRVLKS